MARPRCVALLRTYLQYVYTLAFASPPVSNRDGAVAPAAADDGDDDALVKQFIEVTYNTILNSMDSTNEAFPSMPSRRAPAVAANHLQSTFDAGVDAMLFRSQHRPIVLGLTVSIKLDTRQFSVLPYETFDDKGDAYFDLYRIATVLNAAFEPARSTDLYVRTPTCTVTVFPCGTFLVMNAPTENDAWFAIDLVKTAIERRVFNKGLNRKLSSDALVYDTRTAKRYWRYKYCIGTHTSTYRVQLCECLKTCYGLRGAVEMCTEVSAGLVVRIAQYKTNFTIYEHIIMAYAANPQDMFTAFETIIAPAIERVNRAQASRV